MDELLVMWATSKCRGVMAISELADIELVTIRWSHWLQQLDFRCSIVFHYESFLGNDR